MAITSKRRETTAERDERIVAEAGPWYAHEFAGGPWVITRCHSYGEREKIARAAARILNRIARAKGKP